MRFSVFSAALICLAAVASFQAQAQTSFANAAASPPATENSDAATEPAEEMVLVGKITNPDGPLPGAVIILKGSKQMAVTNAAGEFQLVVPADAGELQAVVTYAGYADEEMTLNSQASESTVSLTNSRLIVVSRKQQLKAFLKTANKQVKQDLKVIHKSQADN